MFRLTKRRLIVFLALTALVPLGIAGMAVWAGWEVASPNRRPVQDYHREYLSHPEAHGMGIVKFTLKDGTPCLYGEPSGAPAKRGEAIRGQLAAMGIALQSYGETRGTVVLLHGRRGRKEDYLPIAERLCACGFRCVIPDLPGHGDHPAGITTYGVREAELPARAQAEAAARFGFPAQPVGLLGISMGGSVAVHAAGRESAPWNALVVVSSFDMLATTLDRNAKRKFGGLLGKIVSGGASYVYSKRAGLPLENIQPTDYCPQIRIPTLVAHGTSDSVISIDAGRRLFLTLPDDTEKRWLEVPGADHDNVLVTDFPIYAEIARWLLESMAERPD
jgi:alpha-beta hydrolase superfamily lysophospholipase